MSLSAINLLPPRLELPRGRAALPESEVEASQQARILQATVEEIAENGFHGASVTGITKRARVSRTTFYQMFTSKTDVFSQAHLAAVEQLASNIRAESAKAELKTWPDRVRVGVTSYLNVFESSPAFAYCFLVDLHSAGDELLDQHHLVSGSHARALITVAKRAQAAGENVRIPGAAEALGVMGATDELTAREIRLAGRGAQPKLSRLIEPITQLQSAILRP